MRFGTTRAILSIGAIVVLVAAILNPLIDGDPTRATILACTAALLAAMVALDASK